MWPPLWPPETYTYDPQRKIAEKGNVWKIFIMIIVSDLSCILPLIHSSRVRFGQILHGFHWNSNDMSNRKILGILLLLFFHTHKCHCVNSSSIKNIWIRSYENVLTGSCLEKYFAHQFKDMSRARFDLIQEPILHRSRFEQLFLQKS